MRDNDDIVNCPNSDSSGGGGDNPSFWQVEIVVRRETLGPNYRKTIIAANRTDAEDRQQFGPEIPYCGGKKPKPMTPGEYCPWQKLYNKTTTTAVADNNDVQAGRTLLVLNQGAHFHSMETFRASFDWFVELFNKIANPRDIVVFRSTVPGHKDCFIGRPNISIPEMTHDKFMEEFATEMYDWNLFDSYNRYAKQKMDRDLSSKVTGHYLNVYNMTVLRFDEHVAATDCLHYMHPGPIDYWNHLLFTNLADMAKQKSII